MELDEENTTEFEWNPEAHFNEDNYDKDGVFKGISREEAIANTREWEALCKRCGACCILRDWANDPRKTFGYCPHLRWKTNKKGEKFAKCRIYNNRNRLSIQLPHGNNCTHISRADFRFLPETCGYKDHLNKIMELGEYE